MLAINFLVNEILAVPAFLIGIITAVGLSALRKPVGTVIGGASHAVAYGLIFESLGRATLQALEHSSQGALNTQNIMQNFEEQLHHDLETRAQSLVRLALGSREKNRQS